MAEYTITLSESTYRSLIAAAQAKGVSPDDLIALNLTANAGLPQPSSEFPEDLIGSINSKAKPFNGSSVDEDDAFGQCVVEKMAKQGIHLP